MGRNGIEEFTRDLRFGGRLLKKSPGFAFTAFLTLALGIGASTAVFSLVDSVLLRPLRYRDSARLVVAWERVPIMSPDPTGPNPRHADLWRKRATAFTGIGLLQVGKQGVSLGAQHPELIGAVRSETNLFDLLEVSPLLGRTFEPNDGVSGRDHVVVITYALWQSMFRGDAAILGRTIRVADTLCQIIGVLPKDFQFPNANTLRSYRAKQSLSKAPEPGIFLPFALDISRTGWGGDFGNFVALARLKPGMTIGQAEAQLESIQVEVNRQWHAAGSRAYAHAFLQPMQEAMVGRSRLALWFLMASVIGLMSIACLNLANAQLARALSRQREAAVRSALGASKWRLVRASLAENIVLGVAGGTAGILLAAVALDLFRKFALVDLPRLPEVHLSIPVLLFSVALTIGSSVLFGLLPALRLTRADPQAALQQNSARAAGSVESRGIRTALIGCEVFGCTALLLLTGLFSKSLLNLLHQDKGFDTDRVTVAEVDLPRGEYAKDPSRINFDDAILNELRAIPGVESAAMVSAMPLEGESWIEELVRMYRPHQETPLLNLRWASPGYFETMHERLIAGRFFEERDRNLSSMIVTEGFARSVWPHENPIGARVKLEGREFNVIGVVADSRITSLKQTPVNIAYAHYKDRPPFADYFVVRGKQSADSLIPAVREAIWRHAPDVTIARVKTLDSQLADSLALERFQTMLLITFGAAALALAMLGIYGVLSYSVAGRKQEIGIRMALGATRQTIYSLALSEAIAPVVAGFILGLVASAASTRIIRDLLYGMKPLDAPVALIVAALLLGAASAAAFLPARRAASVSPMEALRTE